MTNFFEERKPFKEPFFAELSAEAHKRLSEELTGIEYTLGLIDGKALFTKTPEEIATLRNRKQEIERKLAPGGRDLNYPPI